MHQEFPWPVDLDRSLKTVASLDRPDIVPWIKNQRHAAVSDVKTHLILALTSSRYIDHHGPYIGHGTFNGGPILRASLLLGPRYRDLALLQTATYVVDLLRNPNYGPYLLLAMDPVTESTPEASRSTFLAALQAGDQILLAEHRLVGLLSQPPDEVAQLLRHAGLLQYPENEHRLLMVHRSLQLLNDTDGWRFSEPILRAAAQYLASRPHVTPHDPLPWPSSHRGLVNPSEPVDRDVVLHAIDRLQAVAFGEEPALIRSLVEQNVNPSTLYESLSLAASDLLCRTHFDAHGVTGVHCIMDLLQDPTTLDRSRDLAWLSALSGSRIRRQKEGRSDWRIPLPPANHRVSLDEILDRLEHDKGGLHAMQAVATYLRNGGDPTAVTQLLIQFALTTAGPFDAIHNVKMLWGQWQETERSRLPEESWRHLAAGARILAETASTERGYAEPIVDMWHRLTSE